MVPVVELPPATPSTLQVAEVSLAPLTVAVNCCVPFGASMAEVGLIEMLTPPVVVETVIDSEDEKKKPELSQARMTMLCVPLASASEAESWALELCADFTLST